ncbi:MAG TPA: formate dehydrogenase accessory protein FdhE [Firmicutes bacterium]|nr:formate dehydrogenase accessory protein FdhE [Bacillales bacterium]HJA41808.1 formate dehydrogenase accessory protein FdhE [Bacillota bacterium]
MQFISKDYEKLMVDLSCLTNELQKQLQGTDAYMIPSEIQLDADVPFLVQVHPNIQSEGYQNIYKQFRSFFLEKYPKQEDNINKLWNFIQKNESEWLRNTFDINHLYFQEAAQRLGLSDWLPMFMAEHLIRPFIRVMAEDLQGYYQKLKVSYTCKFCNEPIRLARLDKEGQKEVVCPRCYAKWNEKKLQCSVCKEDNHEKLIVLKIDKDELGQIQLCQSCGGYTKLIEQKRLIRKNAADLLDLYSIQFDYIAQEYISNHKEKFENDESTPH